MMVGAEQVYKSDTFGIFSKPGAEDVLKMDKTAFLILGLWAAGVTSSVVEKRLVPAITCPDTEKRYHVRVVHYFHDGKSMTCSGTLIRKRWVITASHCYVGRDGTLKVEIGGHPKTAVKKQLLIKKKNIRVYAENLKEPIMLLKLPEAVKNIKPALLAPGDCMAPTDGEELKVSGYGATTAEGGEGVKDLMCLEVKTLSKNHCPDLSGTSYDKFTYIYCGGGVGGAEIKACQPISGQFLRTAPQLLTLFCGGSFSAHQQLNLIPGPGSACQRKHKLVSDQFLSRLMANRENTSWFLISSSAD
ncbi:hypothetical protein MHYP_G00218980 [Metynnis hypsauchen]